MRPQEPEHLRPPETIARRVRVAVVIGMRVMKAMSRHPRKRPRLIGQTAQRGQTVFDDRRRLVTAVGQEAMKADCNAQAGDNVKNAEHRHRRPAKGERGQERSAEDHRDANESEVIGERPHGASVTNRATIGYTYIGIDNRGLRCLTPSMTRTT
jgi:hypothetical protein